MALMMELQYQKSLNRAVEARHCGRYLEAVTILTQEIPHEEEPHSVLEYADLLSSQGLQHDRAVFLARALNKIRSRTGIGIPPSKLAALLELMLAEAEFWAFGKFEQALDAMRKAQHWLRQANIDSLAKEEIQGFKVYYDLLFVLNTNSNSVQETDRHFTATHDSGVAAHLGTIQQSLLKESRLLEAVTMSLGIINFIQDPGTDASVFKNALDILCWSDDQFNPSLASLSLRVIYSAVDTADTLGSTELQERCHSLLDSHLQRLTRLYSSTWKDAYPIIAFRQQMHDVTQQTTSVDKYIKLKEMFSAAKVRADYASANKALIAAISVASGYAKSRRTLEPFKFLRNTQAEYLSFHVTVTKQAYWEAIALSALLSTLYIVWKDHERAITELKRFEERNPQFDIPLPLESLYHQGLVAANALKRLQIAGEFSDRRDAVYLKCPMVVPGKNGSGSTITDEARADPNLFSIEIDGVWPDLGQRGLNAISVCLRWAANEMEREMMSQEEWIELFGNFSTPETKVRPMMAYMDPQARETSIALYNLDDSSWASCYARIKKWLLAAGRPPAQGQRLYALKAIAGTKAFRVRKSWTDNHANAMPSLEFALRMADLESECKALEALGDDNVPDHWRNEVASKTLNVFRMSALASTQAAWKERIVDHHQISQAIHDCDDLIRIYSEQHNDLGRFNTWCSKGRLLTNQYYQDPAVVDILTLFRPWDEADQVFRDVRRRNLTAQSAITAESLTRILSSYSHRDFCNEAISVSRGVFNVALTRWGTACNTMVDGEAVEQRIQRLGGLQQQGHTAYLKFLAWTQRYKARQLTELLGIETQLPQDLVEACQSSRDASALMEQERELLHSLNTAPFPGDLPLQDRLDTLHAEMRKDPQLAPIMAIRDGDTVNADKIYKMLQTLPERVVLVDFVYVPGLQQLLAICYRKSKISFPARLLVPSLEDIGRDWKPILGSSHPLGTAQSIAYLQRLEPLLRPLFEKQPQEIFWKHPSDPPCILPGDTIIFCPTGILHRIPLHAINVRGEPLIKQHPVVYCQSLTILHHAWRSVAELPNVPISARKSLLVNPMGLSAKPLSDIADKLGLEYIGGNALQRHEVLERVNQASLLHYHGHARFFPSKPMQAELCLDEAAFRSLPQGQRLTANDVFNHVRLSRPALTVVIGCKSGVSAVSDSDDLLGIPTALHYAGASAIVSSLWKLDDADGAEFAKAFYDAYPKLDGDLPNDTALRIGFTSFSDTATNLDLVDLAKATQQAVKQLMVGADKADRSPYHWAAYTLNGFWLFPRLERHAEGHNKNGGVQHPAADPVTQAMANLFLSGNKSKLGGGEGEEANDL